MVAGDAQIAQLVEQWTENPRVGGSIPSLGTTFLVKSGVLAVLICLLDTRFSLSSATNPLQSPVRLSSELLRLSVGIRP